MINKSFILVLISNIFRKLKNRVAAQCARDRKKMKLESLEDEVLKLKTLVIRFIEKLPAVFNFYF